MSQRVSVLTVTQGSRTYFLELQKANLLAQTYSNIIEWVIVDGSKSSDDSNKLQGFLDNMDMRIPVVRVPYKEGRKLGGHRNAGNKATKGDIIACMDDDDYYQPEYISQGVYLLNRSKKKLCGCGPIFLYDMLWKTLFSLDMINPNCSVNNCFVYTREYLKTHSYDDNAVSGEENVFTKDFTEPLEQMDPRKCVVQMSHTSNTVMKQQFMLAAFHEGVLGWYLAKGVKVQDLVPPAILKKYEAVVGDRKECPYDIVYYCGPFSIVWDPLSTSLGGSEQAVVQLAKMWALAGKRVAVYAELTTDTSRSAEGVDYLHHRHFHPWQHFNVLILWRLLGTAPILPLAPGVIKAETLMVDLHDNEPRHYKLIKTHIAKVDKVMFKSLFHVEEFTRLTGTTLPQSKVVVQMNGVQMDVFRQLPSLPPRDPVRFCYASSYDRGIIPIMKSVWPTITQVEPRAELHIYYGINKDMAGSGDLTRDFFTAYINTQNVCDHGRQPLNVVAWEKHRSTFHLYLSDAPAEIDCISVRESLAAGCIPILLNVGVFKERDGLKLDGSLTDPMASMKMALEIIKLMHDSSAVDAMRAKLQQSRTIVSWKDVASAWLEAMQ